MLKRYGAPEKLTIAADGKCKSCGKSPAFTVLVNGSPKKLCSECTKKCQTDSAATVNHK